MEHKIGEIFEYNGEWYQCIKGERCIDCDFLHENGTCIIYANYLKSKMGNCNGRTDNQNVVFKKLEKVGEPYRLGEVLIQQYQGIVPVVLPEDLECESILRVLSSINVIEIIIEQNKEDMKENNDGNTPLNELTDRYVNGNINYDEFEKEVKALYSCKEESKPKLKPFDLESARQGNPVCTRDGRKARIICFDRKDARPIVALIKSYNDNEGVYYYYADGLNLDTYPSVFDLMMPTEKKEGWVNVYKEDDSYTTSEDIYESKEEAIKSNPYEEAYLTTVKIEWEE